MSNLATDWKVPDRSADEATYLGWQREAIQQGENFLLSQRAVRDMDKAIDIIAGIDETKGSQSKSDIRPNRTKRQIREVVATLSDLRPLWGYQTDNRDLYKQNNVLNMLLMGWYLDTFADRKIRTALQFSSVLGTGYVRPIYKRDLWIAGRGDIDLECYGPRDVLFIQMPRNKDIQRTYAVVIRQEVPIAMAHAMYPEFADRIVPNRMAPSSLKKGWQTIQKFMSPVLNLSQKKKEDQDVIFPVVDMYHTYVLDTSVNNTGVTVPMGKPGSSWYYEVPSMGSDIPAGRNSAGQTIYRKAEYQDCMLYPMRRLIISTDTCKIYDDTATDWHGMVPLVRFEADDWPWESLGFSLVRDVATLHSAKRDNMRAMQDLIQVRLAPPTQYDKDSISKATAERFDPRSPNQKIGVRMSMGEGFKPVFGAEYYSIPESVFVYNKDLDEQADYQMGLRDLSAFAKARAGASQDDLEKLLELAGPIVKDMSRGMESSLRDMGEMMKSNFFQYYTAPRRVRYLGEDGITEQDYDFEPGNMVPSHAPDEITYNEEKKIVYPTESSKYPSLERAKMWASQFYFHITPNSLHQVTQMTRKLLYLQLYRAGFPVDPWTLADVLDIPNFGAKPKGTTSVFERWMAFEDIKTERQLEIAQAAGMMQQQSGGPGPNGGQKSTGGRAPSGQAPPTIRQKDGGTRTTIAESK